MIFTNEVKKKDELRAEIEEKCKGFKVRKIKPNQMIALNKGSFESSPWRYWCRVTNANK